MKTENLLIKLIEHRAKLKEYRKQESEARVKANFEYKRIEILLDMLSKRMNID
jgi:hypothetical protein